MNKIGIITAMREEVIALKRKMIVRYTEDRAGMIFYIGTIDEKDIVMVKSGSGHIDAAICTQILISVYDVDFVINTGLAGGLSPEVNIGDMIISSDIIENEADNTFCEVNQALVGLAEVGAKSVLETEKVFVARITSEDQYVSSLSLKEDVSTTFTAYCAETEGSAIAHTCYLNQVPFVLIRSVSDRADNGVEMNYEDFAQLAAKNATKLIESVICGIK